MKKRIILLILFIIPSIFFSQVEENDDIQVKGKIDTVDIAKLERDPLKASLYSAILPGLGQAYNKKYWKIPIVWGAIGTGVGFIIYYNNQYRDFRDGYIASLNGEPTGFPERFTTEILANAQDDQRRNRDYAIVITSLLYALNIVDAIVDAHLSPISKDKDLAIKPVIIRNPATYTHNAGIGLQLNF